MRKRYRLGEMLVQEGILTESQLQSALKDSKGSGVKLGQFLVQHDYCREEDIVDLLSRQLRIPRYSPEKHILEMAMADVIPPDIARQHGTVPLYLKGRVLVVAMSDPLDIDALDSLEIYADLEVEPIVCTQSELYQLFTTMYGMYSGIDDVLESVGEITPVDDVDVLTSDSREMDVDALEVQADQAPVIRLVNSIIAQAVNDKASDIHISPDKDKVQIRFRVDGRLREVPAPSKKLFPAMISRIKILAHMDISMTRVPQDGRFTVTMDQREINMRVSSLPTIYGENLVMRLLDMSAGMYTLEQLGMGKSDLEKVKSIITKPYGMILSTGPTGSGKSTSLYAILKQINQPDVNIITLEDPVEYRVKGIRQVQLNHRAGMTFASGLRSILRQDPDVLMVGEIRDRETANIAVQAAMTGHKVLSTVHTNGAAGAIVRLLDMGIEPFLISSVLLVSFAQRLVRKVCPNCAEPYEPAEAGLASLGLESSPGCKFLHGKGCHNCGGSGFKGRTAVFEILIIDDEVQNMIMGRASAGEITRQCVEAGKLSTLRDDAARKVCQGITTVEEALTVVMA
ncbi:GspE/PulE family protein [Desulfonatronovibrio hydrogenovorans]|uniref:GspE/PulE family protein n=1 Tax=Desulfonatronovibrio hydrogenovorans TaxID=53245 RepID=UPI00048BEE49|nr:GspE/PulE family protein [Desulfonatronovibrio hydrogenovorans]